MSLTPLEDGCVIDAESRSCVPAAVVDWGKNEQNIEQLFDALHLQLSADCRWKEVRLCPNCGYPLIDDESQCCPECGTSIGAAPATATRPRGRLGAALAWVAALTSVEYAAFLLLHYVGLDRLTVNVFSVGRFGPILIGAVNGGAVAGVVFSEILLRRLGLFGGRRRSAGPH